MSKTVLKSISIEQIQQGQYQPRCKFDKEALQELAQSIKSSGLLQPLVVRPLSKDSYEIIAGERRWRAAQLAGFSEIDCLISEYTDQQAAEVAIIENIQRVDLNPVEEARSYERLIKEFNYQHDELAAVIGKSRSAISNLLRILKLDHKVQDLLISGELTEGHGKPLASVPAEFQLDLAKKCIAQKWSVRKLEQEIKKIMLPIKTGGIEKRENADIKRLNMLFSDFIGCKADIFFEEKGKGGKIQMYFNSLDILEGIFEKIGFKCE